MKIGQVKTKVKMKPNKKSREPSFDMPAPAAPSKPERDYDAEHAFDTIMRAEEHKQDKGLMKRVAKHAKTRHKAMKSVIKSMKPNSVQDLRDRAYDMDMEEMGE